MKKTIFYICLAVVWFFITIDYTILAFNKVQVNALDVFWPSILCVFLYADKAYENLNKKEK